MNFCNPFIRGYSTVTLSRKGRRDVTIHDYKFEDSPFTKYEMLLRT